MKNLYLFLILIVTISCATKSSNRLREGNNEGQNVDMTVEQEKQLTKEALAQMLKDYPPSKNQELQNYIKRMGNKIVQANGLHNNPYTYNFTVVDSDQINAFAMPAGEIFITIPIIAMAESEAEIAGVIGHEIGHVVARHTAERMYLQKKEQPKTWLFGGIGAALGGTAGYLLSSKLCAPKDTACKAKYTAYGAGGGALGGMMVQKYGFMQNSQEDELESDRVGFRYAVTAGYDKNHVGDFYRKLASMEEASKKGQNSFMTKLSDAMSSHPNSKDRVKQADEMKTVIKENGSIKMTPEFKRAKQTSEQIVSARKKVN